jgi:predicted nucleotidyltransferase
METLFRKGIYQILKVFYVNGNSEVHLRELARRTGLNENSISRFLNELVNSKILISRKEASVRKFYVSDKFHGSIFSSFDFERFNKLSFDRRKSIEDYLKGLKIKPFCLILFGSSARGHAKKDSDLDLLEIGSLEKNSVLVKDIESERGIRLQVIRLDLDDFKKSILDKDAVILSAINAGFPVFGKDFFYGEIENKFGRNFRK